MLVGVGHRGLGLLLLLPARHLQFKQVVRRICLVILKLLKRLFDLIFIKSEAELHDVLHHGINLLVAAHLFFADY